MTTTDGKGGEEHKTAKAPDASVESIHRGGHYEERGEIGRGGMGIVLRVFDSQLEREIAMKILRDPGPGTEPAGELKQLYDEQLRRFIEEAKITGQLDHPGVVAVHELGSDEKGMPFFTMRLVKGRDLREIFKLARNREDGWTVYRALLVMRHVCEIVAFAHAKGVVHRDLKPSNVMVGRFGETYVMDWGLAKATGRKDPHDIRIRVEPDVPLTTVRTTARRDDGDHDSPLVTMDGAIVGTASYMSPEQAKGRVSEVGVRSDVYALGAMLYHLLVGHPPYLPPNTVVPKYTLLGLVQNGEPPRILEADPNVDVELAAICEKAMSRDAANRYADTMEMAADLEAFLEHRPIAAKPPSVVHVLSLAIRRHPGVAWTGAAGAAALATVATWFLLQLRAENAQKQLVADALASNALVEEASHLRPRVKAGIQETSAWLDRVDDLLQRRASRGIPSESAGGATSPLLSGETDRFEQNLAFLSIRRRTVAALQDATKRLDTGVNSEWDAVLSDIHGDRRYRGLSLVPQVGLVPLSKNEFGYWEFLVAFTGERPPKQKLEPGRSTVRAEDGLVVVLLPGGEATVGSPEFEPDRITNEPLRTVLLDPFFIGKCEITQAQWERVMGANPSRYQRGTREMGDRPTGTHPVESVNWSDCIAFTEQLGLALPAEDQWEYACRVDTRTAYAFGDEAASLEGAENVLDQAHSRSQFTDVAPWNDRYRYHAPVASFRPNAFGLYDMSGNVSEWCAGTYEVDPISVQSSSESRPHVETVGVEKAARGGSWYLALKYDRVAFRQHDLPRGLNSSRGLRVARRIQP